MKRAILVMLLAASAAAFVGAQTETLDYPMLGRIRDEGLTRSQVMDHVSWLSDVYGPRLTGSPGIQQASEWAMKKFGEWGLTNVHQERWALGKGWSLVRARRALRFPSLRDRRHRQRHRQRRDDGSHADPEGRRREAAADDSPRALGRRGTGAPRLPRVRCATTSPTSTRWRSSRSTRGFGPRSVVSTDHVSFDSAGIPAFQFLVDRLEYNSRTHHWTMDTFDRVQREDMVQQATVIAVFAYNAGMREEKLPRKALPAPQRGRGTSQQ